MYNEDIFQRPIRRMLPQFVLLLSEPSKAVRNSVIHLLGLMDPGDLTWAVDLCHDSIIHQLRSPDVRTRIGSVHILTELAGTNKLSHMIQAFIPDVLSCINTSDEEQRLSVIHIFQELLKHEIFYPIVDQSLAQIILLLADDDWNVQNEIVDFLSSMAIEGCCSV
ncbi:hypothetical protein FB45DRAFT_171864 [Roridomyces roridus]|uniref:Protein phosphatase PP2A regulatory subunit A n=1 Tax=Roridomyces roridus TaxID=1738132 RepID=A0AAD7BEP6_9AGAR|nr:hypothetical protein FB45DRAFT_171864 [Roridomyces roridus]